MRSYHWLLLFIPPLLFWLFLFALLSLPAHGAEYVVTLDTGDPTGFGTYSNGRFTEDRGKPYYSLILSSTNGFGYTCDKGADCNWMYDLVAALNMGHERRTGVLSGTQTWTGDPEKRFPSKTNIKNEITTVTDDKGNPLFWKDSKKATPNDIGISIKTHADNKPIVTNRQACGESDCGKEPQ